LREIYALQSRSKLVGVQFKMNDLLTNDEIGILRLGAEDTDRILPISSKFTILIRNNDLNMLESKLE